MTDRSQAYPSPCSPARSRISEPQSLRPEGLDTQAFGAYLLETDLVGWVSVALNAFSRGTIWATAFDTATAAKSGPVTVLA